ncbi:MAG: SIMPL domain-containing protein [Clostridia bacterium]|nr:SIMPL domain-containing protein [Clostridia bacterium]
MDHNNTLTVLGTAKLSIAPDATAVAATLSALSADYDSAIGAAAKQKRELDCAAERAGFSAAALKTTQFNVTAEYESHRSQGATSRVLVGYRCTHSLQIEFALDMERLRALINEFSGCACAPELHIRFHASDTEELHRELLRRAMLNARERAEALAEAAGVELSSIVSITDASVAPAGVSPTDFRLNSAIALRGAHDIDFTPDSVEECASVTAVWRVD